jgi:hypothetical protein
MSLTANTSAPPEAASVIGYPVILKHNRAGKGLGVKLIYSEAALQEHLSSEAFEESVDGKHAQLGNPSWPRTTSVLPASSSSRTRKGSPTPTTSTRTPTIIPTPRPRTAGAACKPSPHISNAFSSSVTVRQTRSPRPPDQVRVRHLGALRGRISRPVGLVSTTDSWRLPITAGFRRF